MNKTPPDKISKVRNRLVNETWMRRFSDQQLQDALRALRHGQSPDKDLEIEIIEQELERRGIDTR